MSFFSGNTKNVKLPDQKLLGTDERRAVSNEQARPVPLIYGERRIAITPLSQCFNQDAQPVEEEFGKETRVTGYNYVCSFAGLVCAGPVNHIKAIYFDDIKVWPLGSSPGMTRGSENHVPITIEGVGDYEFYWGTENQDFDPVLTKLSNDPIRNPHGPIPPNVVENHPAYVGQCYIVARSHIIGYNRTSLQNIEITVGHYPSPAWIGASEVNTDCDIASLIVDSLTNQRFGLGVDDQDLTTRFDRAGILAFSDQLGIEGLGLSPLVNRTQPFKQLLLELLESIDGFYHVTKDGLFTLGLNRGVDCGDVTLPVIDETCLTDVPEIEPDGYGQTVNDVRVRFVNRLNDYKEDSLRANSPANFTITGEPSALVLDRAHICRPDMADLVGQSAAKILALPQISGTLQVRKSRLQGIRAGSAFYFHYSHYNLCWLHCRAKSVTQSAYKPEVTLQFDVDRGFLNAETYTPPAYIAPERILQTADPFTNQIAIELPYDKLVGEVPTMGFLAARKSKMTTKYRVYRLLGSSYLDLNKSVEFFPWHGTLDADLGAADAGPISVTLDGVDVDLPEITADEGTTGVYAALIDDEFFFVHSPVKTDVNKYIIDIIREQFDTKKKLHSAHADVWIFKQVDIRSSAWRMASPDSAGTVVTFKLRPWALQSSVPLADLTPVTITLTDRVFRYWKPRNLNGKGVGRANLTYASGDDISITWTPVNRDGGNTFPVPSVLTTLWIVELRTLADVVFQIGFYTPNTASGMMPWSLIGGALTPAISFKIRIYAKQKGLVSREYDEVTLTPI